MDGRHVIRAWHPRPLLLLINDDGDGTHPLTLGDQLGRVELGNDTIGPR